MKIDRGDILLVDMGEDNKLGSEQKGCRPAVVISCTAGNIHSTTIIVALLTTKKKKTYPMHVPIKTTEVIGKLEEDSTILLEQLYTVDKERVINKKGTINPDSTKIKAIDKAIKISLGIPFQ